MIAVLETYVRELEQRANEKREEGSHPVAYALELVARELTAMKLQWYEAEVSIAEGSRESGYSPAQLRRLVQSGRLPSPLRRCDLPRRPGHGVSKGPRLTGSKPSLAEEILAGGHHTRRGRKGAA